MYYSNFVNVGNFELQLYIDAIQTTKVLGRAGMLQVSRLQLIC